MSDSRLTPSEFVALVLGPDLVAALTLDVRARGLTARTTDAHAAHAVELLATRRGLTVLVTRPDDGSYVIGVKGFPR